MPLTEEEYVAADGAKCPHCGSTNIQGYESSFEGKYAFQEVSCGHCFASWSDAYELVGFNPNGLEGETS